MKKLITILALLLPAFAQETVRIRVDASANQGPLKPVWSFFGYDEPNYTYMKDGKKLLSEIAALSPVTVLRGRRSWSRTTAPISRFSSTVSDGKTLST